jgi:hypothetical protein
MCCSEVLIAAGHDVPYPTLIQCVKMCKQTTEEQVSSTLQMIQTFVSLHQLSIFDAEYPGQTVVRMLDSAFATWLTTLPSTHAFAIDVKRGHRLLACVALGFADLSLL